MGKIVKKVAGPLLAVASIAAAPFTAGTSLAFLPAALGAASVATQLIPTKSKQAAPQPFAAPPSASTPTPTPTVATLPPPTVQSVTDKESTIPLSDPDNPISIEKRRKAQARRRSAGGGTQSTILSDSASSQKLGG